MTQTFERKPSQTFIMAFTVQYEGRSVRILDFLDLDLPDDVKERVWDENNVSAQLFANCNFIDRQLKILQELEKFELWTILKRIPSHESVQQCLNAGLLYYVLVDLKPKTVRKIFSEIGVSFCDHSQISEALKELIKRQSVDAVKCVKEIFQSKLQRVRQSGVYMTASEIHGILQSENDYMLNISLRYFQTVKDPNFSARRNVRKLSGSAALVYEIYTKLFPANDEKRALWRRFVNCLITVKADLAFLAELLKLPKKNEGIVYLLQA